MRGLIEELANPFPLVKSLPGVYQDFDVTDQFLSAFDMALAPVLATLDNLEAYVDPALAPEDFVTWLGGWVGVVPEEVWTVERRRSLVAHAVELYRWRGTARGLRELVTAYAGVGAEIEETGGVVWSTTPGAELPGSPEPRLVLHVHLADPVAQGRLQALVAAATPAHVAYEIKVVAS